MDTKTNEHDSVCKIKWISIELIQFTWLSVYRLT